MEFNKLKIDTNWNVKPTLTYDDLWKKISDTSFITIDQILRDTKTDAYSYLVKEDNNMDISDKVRIKKIEERTEVKTVKVPQYKAAPKTEERIYKIVKTTFKNGHVQEAICMPNDLETYNLELGISICVLKELLGGTKGYNDYIRKAVKLYKDQLAKEKKEKENKEIAERRRAKNEARRAEMQRRKKAAERQEKIDIQAEAYLKAMKQYQDEYGKKFTEDIGLISEI